MKTLVIYHNRKPGAACPDGSASAYVCSLVRPHADFVGWCYQTEPPDVSEYEEIIIVDFSFDAHILEEWGKTKEVLIIDHHKDKVLELDAANLSKRILRSFDAEEKECGATLTWKYFFPDKPVPAFIEYVRDRDIWNWELPYSEEIHEAISYLKWGQDCERDLKRDFAIYDMLLPLNLGQLQTIFAPWGKVLLKPKHDRIRELANTAEAIHFNDNYIAVVEVPANEDRIISDLCTYIYKKYSQFEYVVAWYYSDGEYKLSFRSDKKGSNYDVAAVARRLSGNGHKNAAGARVKELPWEVK